MELMAKASEIAKGNQDATRAAADSLSYPKGGEGRGEEAVFLKLKSWSYEMLDGKFPADVVRKNWGWRI